LVLKALPIQVKGFEDVIARIGMDYHFKSMARGVIDTRDVIYTF
jgi:ABC-2 type transport system permease protein